MVDPGTESCSCYIVLFCLRAETWKVADFGLTSEATSQRLLGTRHAGGTPGFRAPELVRETPAYSNKVDIFALGCTFYQLATERKAFPNDIAVFEYSCSAELPENPSSFLSIDNRSNAYIRSLIVRMLAITPWQRPSARVILEQLESITNTIDSPDTRVKFSPYVAYVSSVSPEGYPAFSELPEEELVSDDGAPETVANEEEEVEPTILPIRKNATGWDDVVWQPHWYASLQNFRVDSV